MALMGVKPKPSEEKLWAREIRMTRLRMTIARRLKEAQENAAMLTTFNGLTSEVISMRINIKRNFKKIMELNLALCHFL